MLWTPSDAAFELRSTPLPWWAAGRRAPAPRVGWVVRTAASGRSQSGISRPAVSGTVSSVSRVMALTAMRK
jgi:hypothetical protein